MSKKRKEDEKEVKKAGDEGQKAGEPHEGIFYLLRGVSMSNPSSASHNPDIRTVWS